MKRRKLSPGSRHHPYWCANFYGKRCNCDDDDEPGPGPQGAAGRRMLSCQQMKRDRNLKPCNPAHVRTIPLPAGQVGNQFKRTGPLRTLKTFNTQF
jgi:hypothetical protein